MRIAKLICVIVIAIMLVNFYLAAILPPGMTEGGGVQASKAFRTNAWLMFMFSDLVTGLLLAVSWIIFREKGGNLVVTALWVLVVSWWGNIFVAVYLYRALDRSQGDWKKVFLGARTGVPDPTPTPVPLLGKLLLIVAGVALGTYAIWGMTKARAFVIEQWVGYGFGYLPIALGLVLFAFRDRLYPRPEM